ncbi:MAG TPA: hypothetical protein VMC80_02915 [Patescibacteria group bacterium]|nr:hypothetical protein [Patescibacteria group bacterium]
MDDYEQIEYEVSKRIEWAKEWQKIGIKNFVAGNIDASYRAIRMFEDRLYGRLDELGFRKYFEERDKTKQVAETLRGKLAKAIDEIAEIK